MPWWHIPAKRTGASVVVLATLLAALALALL